MGLQLSLRILHPASLPLPVSIGDYQIHRQHRGKGQEVGGPQDRGEVMVSMGVSNCLKWRMEMDHHTAKTRIYTVRWLSAQNTENRNPPGVLLVEGEVGVQQEVVREANPM